jgi:hypothetical protein
MLISELLAALSSFADARGRARLCINAQAVGIIQLNQPVGQNIRRAGLPALAAGCSATSALTGDADDEGGGGGYDDDACDAEGPQSWHPQTITAQPRFR